MLAAVGLLTEQTPTCTVDGTLRLTLRHRNDGTATGVRGAPAQLRLGQLLKPWSQVVHTWRWRNWCHPARRFQLTATFNGKRMAANIVAPPKCHSRQTPSRLLDSGPGTRLIPFTGDRIPAHVLPPGTPVPLSAALIHVTNSWLVSDGRTLVAVYAGSAPAPSNDGLFAIVRQNLVFGLQNVDLVNAGPIGATTINTAPTGAAVETTAQHADLSYTSDTGTNGTLHLADDTNQNNG